MKVTEERIGEWVDMISNLAEEMHKEGYNMVAFITTYDPIECRSYGAHVISPDHVANLGMVDLLSQAVMNSQEE